MSGPVVFYESFEEWADAAGLTPGEREAQERWGATVGQRFDAEAQRRHMDKMLAEWAERMVGGE